MLKNIFKITFRNLYKNKIYVLINIFSLGLALSCSIVAYLNYRYYADFDKVHLNHSKIFKIESYKNVQGSPVRYGITPIPTVQFINDDFPNIKHHSRYHSRQYTVKKDLNVFKQEIGFADPDYLAMFTFKFKYGSAAALNDQSSIILTESLASVYFQDQDPRGKRISLVDGSGKAHGFVVGAIIEDMPKNSSMVFGGLMHYDNFLKLEKLEENDWRRFHSATFVMTDGRVPSDLIKHLDQKAIPIQNKTDLNLNLSGFSAERLTDLGKNSTDVISNWLYPAPPRSAVDGPIIMTIQLLLIACFNFTNTAISSSSKRLKEIGLRKVMGSVRSQLILQFMSQNIILCLLSLLVGVLMAEVLVPAYTSMWEFLHFELDLMANPELYSFLLVLLLITAVIAGGYPSLYISKFQPVKIFRGTLSLGGSSKFSKLLLGLQFMITALTLISMVGFWQNANYQEEYDLGYRKDDLLHISVYSPSQYERFRPVLEQMPEIKSVAGTPNHVGSWEYQRALRSEDKEVQTTMMDFTIEYFELMDFSIVEGRFFSPDLSAYDKQNTLVVNETLCRYFDWKEPLGKSVQIDDSTRVTVIGVVKDYHDRGFFGAVKPMALRLADVDQSNFLVIKSDANPSDLYKKLEKEWVEIAPNTPFFAEYNDVLADGKTTNKNIITMFQFSGFAALLLSGIGLYTLISLSVQKRTKELGVRKVLGASIEHLVMLLSKKYFMLLSVACLAGSFAAYYMIDWVMGSIFQVYQGLTVWSMMAPIGLLLMVVLVISSTRIIYGALQNPVTSLRYE